MTADTDQPTLAVTLKPCPFCGGVGDIESQPSYSQAANSYNRYRGWCDHCGYGLDWHSYEPDATTAWNTRTNSEPRPAGDLREALECGARALHEAEDSWNDYEWEYLPDTVKDSFRDQSGHVIRALATNSPAPMAGEGWQDIATCSTWKHDHMHTMLAYWTGRGVCETYWDEDEDYDQRYKGWVSPREGWRAPGDQCIPVNQDSVTHWQPLPAPPAAAHPSTQEG